MGVSYNANASKKDMRGGSVGHVGAGVCMTHGLFMHVMSRLGTSGTSTRCRALVGLQDECQQLSGRNH